MSQTTPVVRINRAFVCTALSVTRLPISAAERLLRRDADPETWPPTLAFSGFEAGVKQFAGAFLQDDELRDEGRAEQAHVAELRRSIELEAMAGQQRAAADREFQEKREEADRRRREADQRAQQREQEIERERTRKEREAEQRAEEREQAEERAREAMQEATERKARDAKAEALAREAESLEEQEEATEAASEVLEVDEAIEASKAARKRKAG